MEAQPFDLPLPTGFTNGQAWGVSGDGIVVGEVDGPAQGTAAAAWRVTAGSVFGPVLLSPNGSIAYDIASLATEVNRVVGEATDSNGVPVATAWDLVVEPGGTFSVGETTTLIFDKQSQARNHRVRRHHRDTGRWSHWPRLRSARYSVRHSRRLAANPAVRQTQSIRHWTGPQ